MENKFDWIPFYEELADKLLEYKDKRAELFDIMKNLASQNSKLEYFHFERDDWWSVKNYEIDPFSIFGSFNRQLTDENRIAIASEYAKIFDLKSNVPTDFLGIPVLNAMLSVFAGNDSMWKLFSQAINCAKNNVFTEDFQQAFEEAVATKGNGLALITIALFWIRPYTYLNLDSQNKQFLLNQKDNFNSVIDIFPELAKNKVPTGKQYVNMCLECQNVIKKGDYEFKNFPEMSHFAWLDNDNVEEVKEFATIVCLYYARLHSDDEEYKNNCTKTFKAISNFTDIKLATLRQTKDIFDAQFDNGRKGYYQRPVQKQSKAFYEVYLKYKDMPMSELKEIVDDIMSKMGSESSNNWWLTANPNIWSFSSLRVGEEVSYSLYN